MKPLHFEDVAVHFARINELIEAVQAVIGPDIPGADENLICHRGITTADKCGRCSRERRIHKAIKELKNER